MARREALMTPTKRCFVISPIGAEGSEIREHADDVFEYIIKPATRAFGIKPVRSDHMSKTGRITDQMFREILHADLCIAVLTGYNANVFYELAVAQAAARPTILLIEKGQPLPFDIKDLRAIEYALQPISEVVKKKTYAKLVKNQIASISEGGWTATGLFEEFDFPPLRDEKQLRHMIRTAAPKPLEQGEDKRYRVPGKPEQEIVVLTGDVKDLRYMPDIKVDVVVSLENTFLQLARYFDASISGSISGTLRYMDAETLDGSVLDDPLTHNLHQRLQEKKLSLPVRPGTVIATPTTQLNERYGIQYVFHVAAMNGSEGDGYRTNGDVLDDCIRNAFNRFARLAELKPEAGLETILFPMLGAATTSLEAFDIARLLLEQTVRKMKTNPACRTTYLLAWLESHRYAVQSAAEKMGLEEVQVEDVPTDKPRLTLQKAG